MYGDRGTKENGTLDSDSDYLKLNSPSRADSDSEHVDQRLFSTSGIRSSEVGMDFHRSFWLMVVAMLAASTLVMLTTRNRNLNASNGRNVENEDMILLPVVGDKPSSFHHSYGSHSPSAVNP